MKNILVLSGYGCKSWIWDKIDSKLNTQCSFDLIDWPDEKLSDFHNLDCFVEWLNSKIVSSNKSYDCIIGHSMGGLVAIHYADKYRDKVKNVVLVESFLKSPGPFFQNLIQDNESTLVNQVTDMLKEEGSKYSKKLPDQLHELDLTDIVMNLDCSISTIYGDRGSDSLSKVKSELGWDNSLLNRVKVHSVENCCHFPMLENSEKLADLLVDLL